jgi:hypothetical protein
MKGGSKSSVNGERFSRLGRMEVIVVRKFNDFAAKGNKINLK